MMDLSQGHDGGHLPGQAQVHIGLIQIKPEPPRIKPADLRQHVTAKSAVGALGLDAVAGLGCEKLRRIAVQLQRSRRAKRVHRIRPPLEGDAVARTHISPPGGNNARILERVGQVVKPAGFGHTIVVNEGHQITRCQAQAPPVARSGDIELVELRQFHRQASCAHGFCPPLRVGHNDNFEIWMGEL